MKLRWLVLALLAGLALPFIVPALAADQTVHATTLSNFNPTTVNVDVGDTVTWVNDGGDHNVHFADGGLDDPPTAQPPTDPEWQNGVSRTFTEDATLTYYCELHGGPTFGMRGTVVVGNGGPMAGTTGTGTTNAQPTNTTPTNTTGTNTTPADTERPAITGLERAAPSFCRRRSRTCRRPGLRFRLQLSEPATLEGVVARTGKLRSAATRKTFARTGRQGANTIKVSARGLAKGRYRLRLTARDAAGNLSPAGIERFVLR